MSLIGIPLDTMACLGYGWKMGKNLCILTGFFHTSIGESKVQSNCTYSFFIGMVTINNLSVISVFRWAQVSGKVKKRRFFVYLHFIVLD